MKNKLLFVFMLGLGLTACEVCVSENGDFDGLWQLATIDSIGNGRSVDMRSSGEYWAVQVHLLEVRNSKKVHGNLLFRFSFENDSLKLRPPYYDESGEGGANLEELQQKVSEHAVAAQRLSPYGIDRQDQSYRIHTLNSSRMVLEKKDVILSFRKY